MTCQAYTQALQRRVKYLSAIQELLRRKVCVRCCLRFAGVRDDVYALAAPSSADLAAAVERLLQQHVDGTNTQPGAISSAESAKKDQASAAAAAAHTQAPVPPADSAGLQAPHASQQSAATKVPRTTSAPIHATQQQPDVKQVQHPLPSVPVTVGSSETDAAVHADADAAAHDVLQPIDSQADGLAPPQNQLQQSHQGSTADLPCPACLGVLQGPEQVLASVPSSMLAGLPEAEGNAGEWKGCINGGATALAACIRQEGHVPTDIGLDITIPAATVTRQLSLLHHLRSKFASQGLYTNLNQYQELVDLKDAVKLTVGIPAAAQLGVKCSKDGTLRVLLAYLHPASSCETDFLFPPGHGKGRGYKRKRGQPKVIYAGRSASETVTQQASRLSHSVLSKHCASPPVPPAAVAGLALRVVRKPVYVAGRYLKLLRGIAQSPWFIDGQRKGESSVEERIVDVVLPAFKADRHKFMTAGREDFDVRMLGAGRPFVLEIINPRAASPDAETMKAMQTKLDEEDHGVQVQALQVVDRSICSLLKAGESEKQKSYTAVCQLPSALTPEMVSKINSTKDLALHQQTPVRVSHRRADLIRHRTVFEMQCKLIDGSRDHFILHLRTQAGTYIKEFVHSDEGRTQPNLASLLDLSTAAKILQLDVNHIHMEFLSDQQYNADLT